MRRMHRVLMDEAAGEDPGLGVGGDPGLWAAGEDSGSRTVGGIQGRGGMGTDNLGSLHDVCVYVCACVYVLCLSVCAWCVLECVCVVCV